MNRRPLHLPARTVEGRPNHAGRNGPDLDSTLTLPDTAATERLARAIAPHLGPGDFLGLTGGLGAGKSTFARALIAARLAALGRAEDIPSPSYTLVQTYDLDGVELWHADLYRLASAGEIAELGLEDAFAIGDHPRRMGRAPRRRAPRPPADARRSTSMPGAEDARRARLSSARVRAGTGCPPRWRRPT